MGMLNYELNSTTICSSMVRLWQQTFWTMRGLNENLPEWDNRTGGKSDVTIIQGQGF